MRVTKPTRRELALQFQSIVKRHRHGSGGLKIALTLTKRLDTIIESVYRSLQDPNKKLVAVVALGGYEV